MIELVKFSPYAPARRMSENWMQVRDGNPIAFRIFENHYSANVKYVWFDTPKTMRFVGPGERIVLIDRGWANALFVWRKFIDDSGQIGVNCAVFHNSTTTTSSKLILEAEYWALEKWGKTRLYTYVNTEVVKSPNPGYCFKKAGWKSCGYTKKQNLLILEKYI
jgi:hypothetical protein